MPSKLDSIIADHNRYIDAIVNAFADHMAVIVARATAIMQLRLHSKLSFAPNGDIERSAANIRTLRSVDKMFLGAMDEQGFGSLVDSYVAQFPGQMRFFHETLDVLGFPPVSFGAGDMSVLASQQISATDAITAAVELAATSAKRQAMFSVAALPFKDLVAVLADKFHASIATAKTMADTSTSVFYRTLSQRGFEVIEKGLQPGTIRYMYQGPLDQLNRPFCRHLESQARDGKTWTREQIDALDNGQIPGVFTSAGGWRCRHQWILAPIGA